MYYVVCRCQQKIIIDVEEYDLKDNDRIDVECPSCKDILIALITLPLNGNKQLNIV